MRIKLDPVPALDRGNLFAEGVELLLRRSEWRYDAGVELGAEAVREDRDNRPDRVVVETL